MALLRIYCIQPCTIRWKSIKDIFEIEYKTLTKNGIPLENGDALTFQFSYQKRV